MEVIAQSVLRPQEKTFGTRKHCNAVVEKTAELLAELHGYRNGLPTAPAILARSNLRPKDRVDGFSQCGQLQLPGLIDTCRFVQSHLGPEAISVMASDSPVTRALVKLNRLWSKKMQHHLVMEVDGERIECARPAPVGPAANAVPCAGTYFATELTFRESDHCISGTLHQMTGEGGEGMERLAQVGKVVVHFDRRAAFYPLMARRAQCPDAYLRISGAGSRRLKLHLFKEADVELDYAAPVIRTSVKDSPQQSLFPARPAE